MVYPIVVYGSPILRRKAAEIEKDYKGLQQLIDDMFETMYKSDGVGLAAPQIGKSIRLFVIDGSVEEEGEIRTEEESENLKDFKKAFINPQIIEENGDDFTFNEGCLSIPKIREDIVRKSNVRIKYYDEKWELKDEVYNGVKARIIQHEYDHLEGIMFTDKLPPLKKKLLKSKLNAITKLKVDVDYKIKFLK